MRMLSRLALLPAAVLGAVVLTAAPALAAPSEQDVTWMQAAHQSNLTEIAAGNAAQQAATTPEVKQLGQMFVQMHTELDTALTQAAQQLGVQLPGEPTAEQQAQLAAVQRNSGQAFDTAWIAQQIGSHTTTLAATQREIQNGSEPAVLEQARTATPVVEQHLAELKQVAAQYGVPTSVPGGSGGQAADGSTGALGWGLAGLGAVAVVAGTAGLVRRRQTAA
jgi:putative membrane protein